MLLCSIKTVILWLPKSHSCFTQSFNKIKLEELFYQHVYLWWYHGIFLSRWENKFWPANYFVFVGKKRESAEGALPFSHERNTNAVWPYSLLTLYWINECVIMIVFKSLRTTETGVGFIWVLIERRWWAQTGLKSSCFLKSMVRMNGRIQTTFTWARSQTFTFCFCQLGLSCSYRVDLCGARNWTLMILMGPLQLRIFYYSIILLALVEAKSPLLLAVHTVLMMSQ